MHRTLLRAVPSWAIALLTASALALLVGCPAEQPEPTPDVGATVEAGVRATLEADAKRQATIEARVATEVAKQTLQQQTSEAPTPTPTPAPMPTPTPWPTATPVLLDPCSNGVAVRHPENNPGLVRDCTVLLSVRDTLAGKAWVGGWSGSVPIDEWEGVTVGGIPPRVLELSLGHKRLSNYLKTARRR